MIFLKFHNDWEMITKSESAGGFFGWAFFPEELLVTAGEHVFCVFRR